MKKNTTRLSVTTSIIQKLKNQEKSHVMELLHSHRLVWQEEKLRLRLQLLQGVHFEPIRIFDGHRSEVLENQHTSSHETISSLSSINNYRSKNIQSKPKRIEFCDQVAVIYIKSYRDYPPTTLNQMYASKKEIKLNAVRNRLEYYAEGHNWKNVLEEDSMYQSSIGEFIHPVHVVGLKEYAEQQKLPRKQSQPETKNHKNYRCGEILLDLQRMPVRRKPQQHSDDCPSS